MFAFDVTLCFMILLQILKVLSHREDPSDEDLAATLAAFMRKHKDLVRRAAEVADVHFGEGKLMELNVK